MPTLKMTGEEAKEFIWENEDNEVVEDEIIDQGRWSTYHSVVVKSNGKFYETTYSTGSTESQDETPFEYDDFVVFTEVEPYEKKIIAYRLVK